MRKDLYYFDYAATTPLDERVFRVMEPYYTEKFGNPSNMYALGREAKEAIGGARLEIADFLMCRPDEIYFTGSATESDNMAVQGVARAYKEHGNKIIVSSVEHKGILSVCEALEKEGFEIAEVRVGEQGLVDLEHFKELLDEKTILVSITYADSETGTLQPLPEIARIIQDFKKKSGAKYLYFHTDASQAVAYANPHVDELGVDLMTMSAQKMYGPKGIGVLYIRRGIRLQPIVFGGGQQGRLRPGTENVPAIVGFGEAVRLAKIGGKKEIDRIVKLRDALEQGIFKSIPKVVLNGHPTKRLPNFSNVSILDIEGEAMLLYLDEENIVVNTGSACNSESLEPSYVLTALGSPYEYVHGSIRFTFGKYSTMKDVKHVLKVLPPIVEKLRKISPLNLDMGNKKEIAQPKAFVGGKTPHFVKKQQKKQKK